MGENQKKSRNITEKLNKMKLNYFYLSRLHYIKAKPIATRFNQLVKNKIIRLTIPGTLNKFKNLFSTLQALPELLPNILKQLFCFFQYFYWRVAIHIETYTATQYLTYNSKVK